MYHPNIIIIIIILFVNYLIILAGTVNEREEHVPVVESTPRDKKMVRNMVAVKNFKSLYLYVSNFLKMI